MEFQKKSLFGVEYALVDYELASRVIVQKAMAHESYGVSALAVHGLVTVNRDSGLRNLIKAIDLIVPDGQPIRWALNSIHNSRLKDRVYGPTLTLHILERANENRLTVFLYGSTANTLAKLCVFIGNKFPHVVICGVHPDRFREATRQEDQHDIDRINSSGAHIVLVGRGCPRQEVWVANHVGKINAVMMAVGAAFDFHAGILKQAPEWMQRMGLEWLFRLLHEPRRLWKRYLTTNSYFVWLFLKFKILGRGKEKNEEDARDRF